MSERLTAWLDREVNGSHRVAAVARLRLLVGALASLRAIEAWRLMRPMADDNWLRTPWADWLPEPTTPLLAVGIGSWLAAGLLFAAGVRPRWSGAVLLLAIVGVTALDQQAYGNHVYLLAILVTLVTLASDDAAAPAWPLLLVKVQVSVVYVFAALTKLNDAWLSGGLLRRYVGSGLVDLPDSVTSGGGPAALAIAIELAIAFGLWFGQTRRAAVVLGVGFHLAIALTIGPFLQLVVFSGLMVATYPLFGERPGAAPTGVRP